MKINTLKLQDFRCFDDYQLEFSDRFTLLIGDNGSGKTAILEALASCASEFLEGFPSSFNISDEDKRPIATDDIHHKLLPLGQNFIKESTVYTLLRVNGVIFDKAIAWRCLYTDPEFVPTPYDNSSIETAGRIRALVNDASQRITDANVILPVISYYGTGRLWKEVSKENGVETLSPHSRLLGYKKSLNPASNLEILFRWFKTQELAALQKQTRRHVLEAVREAIVSMVPDANKAWWDIDWDELLIETVIQGEAKTIPFHLLSDGYRNLIGLAADIAYRMATLNPQLETDVIKKTEGIVLIDEIDLHLHPKWQRQVVGRLLDTFPKVQFVASSHSPFIIQSLYHRDDVLLWDLEKAQAVDITSKSIEDIAEDQQGVEIPQQSQRFLDMEKAAEAYYSALKQIPIASEDEKQHLRQRLDELLIRYSDDPAFQAFLKMERLAVEGNGGA